MPLSPSKVIERKRQLLSPSLRDHVLRFFPFELCCSSNSATYQGRNKRMLVTGCERLTDDEFLKCALCIWFPWLPHKNPPARFGVACSLLWIYGEASFVTVESTPRVWIEIKPNMIAPLCKLKPIPQSHGKIGKTVSWTGPFSQERNWFLPHTHLSLMHEDQN